MKIDSMHVILNMSLSTHPMQVPTLNSVPQVVHNCAHLEKNMDSHVRF